MESIKKAECIALSLDFKITPDGRVVYLEAGSHLVGFGQSQQHIPSPALMRQKIAERFGECLWTIPPAHASQFIGGPQGKISLKDMFVEMIGKENKLYLKGNKVRYIDANTLKNAGELTSPVIVICANADEIRSAVEISLMTPEQNIVSSNNLLPAFMNDKVFFEYMLNKADIKAYPKTKLCHVNNPDAASTELATNKVSVVKNTDKHSKENIRFLTEKDKLPVVDGFYLLQEYVDAKPVQLQEKQYNPTGRLFLLLTYKEGKVEIDCVDAFWKLPDQPCLDRSNPHFDNSVPFDYDKEHGATIEQKTLQMVLDQLNGKNFQGLFCQLFTGDYIKELTALCTHSQDPLLTRYAKEQLVKYAISLKPDQQLLPLFDNQPKLLTNYYLALLPKAIADSIKEYHAQVDIRAEQALQQWCNRFFNQPDVDRNLKELAESDFDSLKLIAAHSLLRLCKIKAKSHDEYAETYIRMSIAIKALEKIKKTSDVNRLKLLLTLYSLAANIFLNFFNDPFSALSYMKKSEQCSITLKEGKGSYFEESSKVIVKSLIPKKGVIKCYLLSGQHVQEMDVPLDAYINAIESNAHLEFKRRVGGDIILSTPEMIHYLYNVGQIIDLQKHTQQYKKLNKHFKPYTESYAFFSTKILEELNGFTRSKFGVWRDSGQYYHCYQLYTYKSHAHEVLEALKTANIGTVSMMDDSGTLATLIYLKIDNPSLELMKLHELSQVRISDITIKSIELEKPKAGQRALSLRLNLDIAMCEGMAPYWSYEYSLSVPRELRAYIQSNSKSFKGQLAQLAEHGQNFLFMAKYRQLGNEKVLFVDIVAMVGVAHALLKSAKLVTGMVDDKIINHKGEIDGYQLPITYLDVLRLLENAYRQYENSTLLRIGTRRELTPIIGNPAYIASAALNALTKSKVMPIVDLLNTHGDLVQFGSVDEEPFKPWQSKDGKVCAMKKCENKIIATNLALRLEAYRANTNKHAESDAYYVIVPDIENANIQAADRHGVILTL